MFGVNILVFMISLVITLWATPWVKRLAVRWGAVDIPNKRKIHIEPIPRLGGIGIYVSFVTAMLIFAPLTREMTGILLGGTVIAALGVVDDIKELSPKVKFAGQIIAAMIPVGFGVCMHYVTNPLDHQIYSLGYWAFPLTVFWIVAITNTLNLIDGLDGLAAGVSSIASVTLLVIALIERQGAVVLMATALAGSSLGFLKYNFNPATIFMGDTGSMFLGYMLGTLSIVGFLKSATIIAVGFSILALGLPIADTSFAILRRFIHKKPIFKPDKGHLHHRLLAAGLSQRQAVLLLYLFSAFMGGNAIFVASSGQIYWIQLAILMAMAATVNWSLARAGSAVANKSADKKVE